MKVVLFYIIGGIIIYGIICWGRTQFKDETYKLKFKGQLDSKYIDNNDHNRPKLKIIDGAKIILYDVANDKSRLFEYAQKGDSVFKLPNSFNIRVCRLKKETIFRVKF